MSQENYTMESVSYIKSKNISNKKEYSFFLFSFHVACQNIYNICTNGSFDDICLIMKCI